MINNINNIIDKTYDKIALKTLKIEITKPAANVDEIVNKYINEHEDENSFNKTNYQINLGYGKTLKDCKRKINKSKPYGTPKNYRELTVKAKGEWKNIYEIAFGTPNETITTKTPVDKKTKQFKIKEAI